MIGIFASFIVGRRLSASTAAVAGTVAGLVNGAGLTTSLLMGGSNFLSTDYCYCSNHFSNVPCRVVGAVEAVAEGGGFGGGGYSGGGGGFGGGEHQVHGNENRNNRNRHLSKTQEIQQPSFKRWLKHFFHMPAANRFFNKQDQQAIAQAVTEAEHGHVGEIQVVIEGAYSFKRSVLSKYPCTC